MVKKLVQALSDGAGKTVSQAARGATRRALKDIPTSDSIYKLGFGIGPMLRNTAESYKQQKETAEAAKTAKDNLNFTKENVVATKNMSTQLTALTSIMSDIRKISLAHLSLARMNAKAIGRQGMKPSERAQYLDLERQIESVRGAPLTTTVADSKRGGAGASILDSFGQKIGFGLLGLLALANAKEIGKFLEETGVTGLVKEGTKEAVKGIASLIGTSISNAIKGAIPALISSVSEDLKLFVEGLSKGDGKKAVQGATGLASTAGGLGGAIYGFRKGRGLFGRVMGAAIGGTVGYTIPQVVGEQGEQIFDPTGKTDAEKAKNKQNAIDNLTDTANIAAMGLAGYSLYKRFTSNVAPLATTAASTTAAAAAEAVPDKMPGRPRRGSLSIQGDAAFNKTWDNPKGQPAGIQKAGNMFRQTLDLMSKISDKIGLKKLAAMIGLRIGSAAAQGALAGAWGGPIAIITTLLRVGFELYGIYTLLSEIWEAVQKDEEMSSKEATATPAGTSVPVKGTTPTNATPASTPAGTSTAPRAAEVGADYANPIPSGAMGSKGRFAEEREGGRLHKGVDIDAAVGTPVAAIANGKVFMAGAKGGYGNMIEIHHDDGSVSRYAHLSEINVAPGNVIRKGQIIGKVGNTGKSEGPHLHLELINQKGDWVNPRDFIPGIPAYTGKDSGKNPEGSISSISGAGQVTASGIQPAGTPTAPATPGEAFSSVFGFNPSSMGINMKELLTGKELKELNDIAATMTGQPIVIAAPQQTQQTQQPVQQAAPAQPRTTDNTQSREKDTMHILNALSFGGPPPMIFP